MGSILSSPRYAPRRIDVVGRGPPPTRDVIRSRLNCPICTEIFFEPTTTPCCGYCFCITCLQSAMDQNGQRCPRCRELIRMELPWAVTEAIWLIELRFFPEEVEARRQALIRRNQTTRSDQRE